MRLERMLLPYTILSSLHRMDSTGFGAVLEAAQMMG